MDHYKVNKETALAVVDFLTKNNIPFKKDVTISKQKNICAFIDFVLNDSVVLLKTATLNEKTEHMNKRAWESIEYVLKWIPTTFIVNVFVNDLSCANFINKENHFRVNFINKAADIKFTTLDDYYCDHAGLIRTLGSFINSDFETNKSVLTDKLHITKSEYNRAIVIMNDEEIDRLKEYNFKLVDGLPSGSENYILLKNTGTSNKQIYNIEQPDKLNELFTKFDYRVKLCGLEKDGRIPFRLIDGVTSLNKSGKIVFNEFL